MGSTQAGSQRITTSIFSLASTHFRCTKKPPSGALPQTPRFNALCTEGQQRKRAALLFRPPVVRFDAPVSPQGLPYLPVGQEEYITDCLFLTLTKSKLSLTRGALYIPIIFFPIHQQHFYL